MNQRIIKAVVILHRVDGTRMTLIRPWPIAVAARPSMAPPSVLSPAG